MKEIVVPAPPKEAFNKHRRMSDLIKKQVEHFKFLEHKLAPEQRSVLPQHAITTEDEAARYIAAMTRLLLAGKTGAKEKPLQMRKPVPSTAGLALAASGDDSEANSEKVKRAAKPAGGETKRKA